MFSPAADGICDAHLQLRGILEDHFRRVLARPPQHFIIVQEKAVASDGVRGESMPYTQSGNLHAVLRALAPARGDGHPGEHHEARLLADGATTSPAACAASDLGTMGATSGCSETTWMAARRSTLKRTASPGPSASPRCSTSFPWMFEEHGDGNLPRQDPGENSGNAPSPSRATAESHRVSSAPRARESALRVNTPRRGALSEADCKAPAAVERARSRLSHRDTVNTVTV